MRKSLIVRNGRRVRGVETRRSFVVRTALFCGRLRRLARRFALRLSLRLSLCLALAVPVRLLAELRARARACTGVWLRRGRRPATRVPPWRRATQILSTRRGTRRSSRRTPRRRRRRSRRRRAAGGPRPARSRARSPRWSWREGPRDGGRSRRNPNAIPIRHSRERRRDSERALTPPPVSTPAALRSRFRSVQARPRGSSRARARRPLGARGGVCGGEGEARGPLFVRAIAPTLSRMRHLANVLEALPVSTRSAAPISSVATLGQTVAKTSVFRGRRLIHARRRERVPSVRSGGASSRSRARGGGFLRRARAMRNLVASSIRRWRLPLAPNLASADGASEQIVATCYDAESRVTYAVTDACNLYGVRDSAREGDDAELCLEMCLVESVPSATDAFDTPGEAQTERARVALELTEKNQTDQTERDARFSTRHSRPHSRPSRPIHQIHHLRCLRRLRHFEMTSRTTRRTPPRRRTSRLCGARRPSSASRSWTNCGGCAWRAPPGVAFSRARP